MCQVSISNKLVDKSTPKQEGPYSNGR